MLGDGIHFNEVWRQVQVLAQLLAQSFDITGDPAHLGLEQVAAALTYRIDGQLAHP